MQASWYGPVATGVSVLQRFPLVVLRVDRKQRFAQQQQSRGILFREIIYFPFFSRTERTRFVLCGLRVERHADQPKQVARLVRCGVVQLRPGCQYCKGSALVWLRVDRKRRIG